MSFKTTKEYLDHYAKSYKQIEVVFRPHVKVGWGRNRKHYDYDFDLEYNHRDILDDEVVFDFDNEDKADNILQSDEMTKTFNELKINYSMWSTGGGGIHVHTLWENLYLVPNLSTMKKTILKTFGYGRGIDYQLSGKHLIRTEWGLYEKNSAEKDKKLIVDHNGLTFNKIPSFIFSKYTETIKNGIIDVVNQNVSVDLDENAKKLINGELKVKDGRERLMFYLIHALKKKHSFKEVVNLIQSWYQYTGGLKLTKEQIRNKVVSHWNKTYHFSKTYVSDLVIKEVL